MRRRRLAAEAGDADAMAHVGHMYANGAGVEQSNLTALRWFKEAAEQNVRPPPPLRSCARPPCDVRSDRRADQAAGGIEREAGRGRL